MKILKTVLVTVIVRTFLWQYHNFFESRTVCGTNVLNRYIRAIFRFSRMWKTVATPFFVLGMSSTIDDCFKDCNWLRMTENDFLFARNDSFYDLSMNIVAITTLHQLKRCVLRQNICEGKGLPFVDLEELPN